MIPTGKEWVFPHGFKIQAMNWRNTSDGFKNVEEHTRYELTCNGNFVAYGDSLAPMLKYLGKQLEGENQ